MSTKGISLAFVVLMLAGAASAACAPGYASQIDSVMAVDTLNQASADSAPQQSVVNGWTARDLLELQARQNVELTYLLYGLLAVGLISVLLLIVLTRRIGGLSAALSKSQPSWPIGPGGQDQNPL